MFSTKTEKDLLTNSLVLTKKKGKKGKTSEEIEEVIIVLAN